MNNQDVLKDIPNFPNYKINLTSREIIGIKGRRLKPCSIRNDYILINSEGSYHTTFSRLAFASTRNLDPHKIPRNLFVMETKRGLELCSGLDLSLKSAAIRAKKKSGSSLSAANKIEIVAREALIIASVLKANDLKRLAEIIETHRNSANDACHRYGLSAKLTLNEVWSDVREIALNGFIKGVCIVDLSGFIYRATLNVLRKRRQANKAEAINANIELL